MAFWIWAVIVFAALYVNFIVFPSVVSFHFVFRSKPGRPVSRETLENSYYKPWTEELLSAMDFVQGIDRQKVEMTASDGTVLVGDLCSHGSDTLVIMFHGYNVKPWLNYAIPGRLLYEAGYDLLMTDQRGHARSGGKHTTMGVKEADDVLEWVDWAGKNTSAKNIVLYGVSMGGTTVLLACDRIEPGRVKALVTDGGYTSVYDEMCRDLGKRHMPYRLMLPYLCLMAKGILKVDLKKNVRDSLGRNRIPTVFLHGKSDATVPFEQGRASYEACASEKLMIVCEEANHTCTLLAGAPETGKQLLEFIGTCTNPVQQN